MSSAPVARPLRLALTGAKGSGKSTVAQGMRCQVLSFASPLKKIVQTAFPGIHPKYLYHPDWKEAVIPDLGVSGRQLLQKIGTDLFRDGLREQLPELKLEGGSVWINAFLSELARFRDDVHISVVVDDCRFPDEYTALKKAGFTVIHLTRPSTETGATTSAHASEQGCPSDHTIVNDGTVDELMQKVYHVCGLHLKQVFYVSERRKTCKNHDNPSLYSCGICGMDCTGADTCGCEGHAAAACPSKNPDHYLIAGCPDCKRIAFPPRTAK